MQQIHCHCIFKNDGTVYESVEPLQKYFLTTSLISLFSDYIVLIFSENYKNAILMRHIL